VQSSNQNVITCQQTNTQFLLQIGCPSALPVANQKKMTVVFKTVEYAEK